jgi:hypothetical protein
MNRDTAQILPSRRSHWSFDEVAHRAQFAKNERVRRRTKQALGEALAMALFQVEFGHKPDANERAEILPKHHTSTPRRVRAVVTIDLSFLE